VAARAPRARLLVAGFGTFREALGELAAALAGRDLPAARAIASRGREMQGAVPGELRYLAAFFDSLHGGAREEYLAAAPRAMRRLHFTGRIEHADVPALMGASLAVAVPSTFPEAFGMVVAEAACCGALPVSAGHSGLREVSALLAPALPDSQAGLLTFGLGPSAVGELAGNLAGWLAFAGQDPAARHRAADALADLARGRFGWDRVAEGVLAAAAGRLSELPALGAAAR
jgi:glycosyltransferase involved in cell wall biosynthesis